MSGKMAGKVAENETGRSVAPKLDETDHQANNALPLGVRAAAVYALVTHRLQAFYDHEQWLTQGQGATLCQEWLLRSKRSLPLGERKQLSDFSEQVALQIRNTLSREAGLYTAHELMESLDPRYVSELGASIMEECVRVLKNAELD